MSFLRWSGLTRLELVDVSFFFFQAEDGIRDLTVTGVQTCALPICRFPRVVAGENQPPITEASGRLELAKWIASPTNPLTARVLVNRLWQHHFGEGQIGRASCRERV